MGFISILWKPFIFFHLVLVLLVPSNAFSSTHVKELPGFDGTLPFYLETGYVTVGDVEFFYQFIKSEGYPAADPLFLYVNGGPGCSGINGFFYQIGPIRFKTSNYTGGLPTLLYEEYSWTKTANIIFLDAPVGTGFTYSTTTDGWNATDTLTSEQIHLFMRNWLVNHTEFQTNPFFLGSDSYAGLYTPMTAQAIIDGNEDGLAPFINLKGISLSCPHTETYLETNAKIAIAHRLTLISDALYKEAKKSCSGNYAFPPNSECEEALAAIAQCIELINPINVLEPLCSFLSPEDEEYQRSIVDNSNIFLPSMRKPRSLWCKNFEYLLSDIWLNFDGVQDALGVRNGTVKQVFRCNISLEYTYDMNNVVPYHLNLTESGLQVLVFSGDHDMIMPHNGIETWIKDLGLTVDIDWRPWYVDGQVAGYSVRYTNSGYRLTYATLKGSGHSPPEYKRKECAQMFDRWIHYYPI